MEEKELSRNNRDHQRRKRKRKSRRYKKRTYRLLLAASLAVVMALAALLCILLFVILSGRAGKEAEQAMVLTGGAGSQSAERFRELTEEVLERQEQSQAEPERVSTVKEIAAETDETTVGIDVSEYQGNIDWSQAAEGLDFVMVRVGYRSSETGEITEDACARYNLQEARDQGLLLGAYFFSTAVSEEEAVEEARWVCELLKGYPITYMAFRLDHEGPFAAPRDPEDFDSDHWRSVEGPRVLFGRDTAETRRQKLKK